MRMFELKYFSTSKSGLPGSSFENKERTALINLDYILSLSELERFTLPFSGRFVGTYASVTMSNDDYYHIKEEAYNKLKEVLFK